MDTIPIQNVVSSLLASIQKMDRKLLERPEFDRAYQAFVSDVLTTMPFNIDDASPEATLAEVLTCWSFSLRDEDIVALSKVGGENYVWCDSAWAVWYG